MQDSIAKEKKWGKKCLEICAIKGGGVGPLMANAILNFHFDYLTTSLTQTTPFFFYKIHPPTHQHPYKDIPMHFLCWLLLCAGLIFEASFQKYCFSLKRVNRVFNIGYLHFTVFVQKFRQCIRSQQSHHLQKCWLLPETTY